MSDELRAAAERWRQRQTDDGCETDDDYHEPTSDFEDNHTLANWAAPLLDPTPIDEAWLRACGWKQWPDDSEFAEYDLYLPMADEISWECRLAYQSNGIYALRMCAEEVHAGLVSESVELFGSRNRKVVVTRGQLRLLCLALGIPLKEPTT